MEIEKRLLKISSTIPGDSLEAYLLNYNPNFAEYKLREELLENPPELVTLVWQSIWAEWGKKTGTLVEVPPINRDQGQIIELGRKGRMLIYVPQVLSIPEALPKLGQLFNFFNPIEPDWVTKPDKYRNVVDQYGWLDVESQSRTPNRPATQQLLEGLQKDRKTGQTLNTYLIASCFSRLVTGEYFDVHKEQSGESAVLSGTLKTRNNGMENMVSVFTKIRDYTDFVQRITLEKPELLSSLDFPQDTTDISEVLDTITATPYPLPNADKILESDLFEQEHGIRTAGV